MEGLGALFIWPELVLRELALFAAVGFLFFGLGDLAVDLIWIGRALLRPVRRGPNPACVDSLAAPQRPGRLAVFVPAWDESAVIGDLLRHALAAWDGDDFVIFVGCYPNDPATGDAVRSVVDARVRAVTGEVAGPTTKADCLNLIARAMAAEERRTGIRFKAAVLHDAEDVVHSSELRLFDRLIERADLVQLPVLPLVDSKSRWIAGHYIDEFAEAHGKELVVREALGAGLPSAGVGCAIARDALDRLAGAGRESFDAGSLTEDYELGLRLRALGGRAAFVRLRAARDRPAVATREYFPATFEAAVAQKSRWMTGIALSGWDRLGWGGGFAECWMRLRDRQSVLAAIVLAAGYAASLLWALLASGRLAAGIPAPRIEEPLRTLLLINGALLGWRLAMRFGFVANGYGWREGLRAIPRVAVGNAITMFAARRAVMRYLGWRRGEPARWDKTAHAFPARLPAE